MFGYLLTIAPILTATGDVQRFRKPLAVQPADRVPDLEPRILDRTRQAVVGAGAAERKQVPAGLEDAEGFGPSLDPVGNPGTVPALPHEAELVGRVGHNRVRARLVQGPHDLDAVALANHPAPRSVALRASGVAAERPFAELCLTCRQAWGVPTNRFITAFPDPLTPRGVS